MNTRGVEGIETRMVGRDAELKHLQDALVVAMEDRELQIITIVGEAGIGKSRLLYEFDNWVDLLPETVWYFKGRAQLETQKIPYGLIRDLFAFRFQIQESDSLSIVWQKFEQGMADVLGAGEQSQMKAHFVGQLVGFDFSQSRYLQAVLEDAKKLRDRALVYLRDFFVATAMIEPIIVLLEDLHWADDSSLDLLNHLAGQLHEQPLLMVCTARPNLFERRPHWGEGLSFHLRLDLRLLSKRDNRRLVNEILRRMAHVPDALRELIIGGAEGNPFYTEELVKMLLEDGVIVKAEEKWRVMPERLATATVPATLTGVLQARLDALPQLEKMIIQRASVVGRIFWDEVVRFLATNRLVNSPQEVHEVLITLRQKEMIFQRETSTFADVKEYIFKHAVLRDVTYESVLKRERQRYHARVAEWLIEHSKERRQEYAGLIAEHLEQAGNVEQAVTYLYQAGQRAANQHANEQALLYFDRALGLVSTTELKSRIDLLLGREQIYDL